MNKKYQLISADTPGKLSDAINVFLDSGWELWGNPFYSHSYCQAVVKFEENGLGEWIKGEAGSTAGAPAPGFNVGAPARILATRSVVALSWPPGYADKGDKATFLEEVE